MINCVIIGCGKIAGGYDSLSDSRVRTHAKAISINPKCKLFGVYDLEFSSALIFAKQWNSEKVFKNINELKDLPKVNLVSICTPTNTHEEIFQQLAIESIPIVWLEKPAALSLTSALKMKKTAEEKSIKVWVNYFRRYSRGLKRIKKILDAGEIGTIELTNAYYTKGLRNNGSHMLDLANWFFGDLGEIQSVGKIIRGQYPSASFVLTTKKCPFFNAFSLDYEKFEMFELDIIGSKGRVQILDGGRQIKVYHIAKSNNYIGYDNLALKEEFDGELDNFMQVGLEMGLNGEVMPNLDNEIVVQQAIEAIEKKSGVLF